MRTTVSLALAGALLTTGVAATTAHADDIERYLKIRTPSSPTLAPDGTVYVRDWPDGIFQVYRREAGEGPDSTGSKLTSFDDGISGFSLSPDGKLMLVSASIGGSEQNDIFKVDPITGETEALYSDPNIVYSAQTWSRDGSKFIYSANDDSPSDFHLYIHDLNTGDSRKILGERGYWYAADLSEDGTRALVGRYFSASSSEAYELDLATGELTDLSVRDDNGQPYTNFPGSYLPGTNDVVLVTDMDDGIGMPYRKNLATGNMEPLLPDLGKVQIGGAAWNQERSLLGVTANRDGFGEIHVYEYPSFNKVDLPDIPEGIQSLQDIQGTTIVYSVSNMQTTGQSFAFDLDNPSAEIRQITQTETQGFDFSDKPLPELVKFSSFDGLEIPAFLYLPADYKQGDKIPFIINYHGGPEGQHRPGFSSSIHYFLDNGFGYVEPNVRGSTGYGRSFHQLDNYKLRWDSVRDGVAAARYLVDNGYTEPGMIAAMGGSYGGFMASAVPIEDTRQAKARNSELLFGASINVVGIVNFKTFLELTKDYRRKLREVEYGPLSDPEFLQEVSPLAHVDEIQIPMLLAHGLNDPRVPIAEAIQLAEALQRNGEDPELVFFHDEGHGFAKLENRTHYFKQVVRFLNEHIKN